DKLQLLLCIIPGGRDDVYGAIKKLCCVQSPVPSQVINAQSLTGHPGKIRSVVQKVLLQINCKLGGQLWGVDIPLKQLMVVAMAIIPKSHLSCPLQKQFTVVGMDIISKSHLPFPAPLSLNPTSVPLSRRSAQLVIVAHSLGIVAMAIIPKSHLSCLLQKQLMVVGMAIIPKSQLPFPAPLSLNPTSSALRCQNPHFGVEQKEDWGLFGPCREDFFLLAHHSRQGCSVPTRYICMWNTANLSSEHLQRLTFKLCHLYWNWPGTIRVPAPCKYAHKLALLVGQVLHHEPSAHLCEQLFFL
ncbi:PIWL2 protein, partial [Calcarius ornatus]|nr:PIWL2 protein [Calcarius ornatus]